MSVADIQKKSMQDALERRFAVAKAEVQQQQHKSLKRVRREDHNLSSGTHSVAEKAYMEKIVSLAKQPSAKEFLKNDAEHQDAEYAGLAHTVDDKLLKTNVKLRERRGGVADGLMHELLQKGDSAHKYLQGLKSMKPDNWILLDNYVQGRGLSSIIKNSESQNNFKRTKKRMSMKQLKTCLDLLKEIRKYKIFLPLHELWKEYMKQLLKPIGNAQLAQCILDADLHGSIIIVANCKMSEYIGVTGIMIRETAETFGIITSDDKFKAVPKKLSVFIFQVEGWKITLLGDKLINRIPNS